MARACATIKMKNFTVGNSKMIKEMAMVNIFIKKAINILGNGLEICDKAKAH